VWDPVLFGWTMALVAMLLVGAFVIWLVDRWRKRNRDERLSSGDQLSEFRQLYEDGELSAEEYARVRGLLTGRMMQELEKAAPPEAPEAAPPRPPDPTN
jgi:uncharacterized membrane protein